MKKLCLLLFAFWGTTTLIGQDYFPKNDGVHTPETNYTVFQNAVIHTNPGKTLKKASLVIQNDKIIAVGSSVNIPENSRIIDLEGKHVYPSFIDIYSDFGIKKPKKNKGNPFGGSLVYDATRKGYYWNDHIRPETEALPFFKYDTISASKYLKQGFGVVQTHVPDGIARGTGMLIALNHPGGTNKQLLDNHTSQFFSFRKSSKSKQVYPTSLMGAIALLRQMYHDLSWYESGNSKNMDLALEALKQHKGLPSYFEAGSALNCLRADKVGDQFGIQYILVGGEDAYERIDEIKATNATYILPLNFPKPYDVSDPYAASAISLEDMRTWNQAPSNPGVLAKNQISFAFSAHKLKDIKTLQTNIKKAIQYGLDKKTALAALTTVPAQLLGKSEVLGTLKAGAYANFLITNTELFEKETILYENWVQGQKTVIKDRAIPDINGSYDLTISGKTYIMTISGKPAAPKAEITLDSVKLKNKLTFKNKALNLLISGTDSTKTEYTRIVTKLTKKTDRWSGKAVLPDGTTTSFVAKKKTEVDVASNKKDKEKEENTTPKVVPITFPNKAYGYAEKPKATPLLFKNATVWTNEAEGIVTTTDVLVKNGKIAAIGKKLKAGNATEIDATGKHLTSGIIDEHSHIATSAINEAGHNSSAEVTIEDVVNPDDMNIYRNLAGGVTSIQILHGSANPIGGRSAIIKLKWGETADKMIFENSPKFIKFALGENVKQSNWGGGIRFPQTRMGVEQVYTDYFTRAKAYEAKKKSGKPYRKDTELETLVEILNGQRFVSCHSYVQSEINMLMKVAEKFDFRINTFTHILEGYKVADKMKAHGVGGSTFSDWWAYKYEVNDAIPYNAAIMHQQGVVTAINSDDPEMSRRLNQEAAKSVKYGGVSEEDAWKFVTLNPAKLLHIDNRTGSIKVGKDADLVLWSDNPLSIYAKAEKTMVDGAIYFDLEKDKAMRKAIAKEKNELTMELLKAKNKGLKTQPVTKKVKKHIHCDTLEEL